ncbi:MAG: hypothetical protein JXB47_11345 [Anaerolineae bacterium]|nr:hypothetical protein [Anaerolineae bacterium]
MSSNANFDVIPDLDVSILLSPVSGDLRVRGWESEALSIRSDRVAVNQKDGTNDFTVTGTGDVKLSLPARASLKVGPVAGDVRVTDIEGEILLNNVSGDLILRDVGPATLANISADLRARRISGDLTVDHVGSDATVREVAGDVSIKNVGADLFVGNVQGSCVVERVGSDLVLSMPFHPDHTYDFTVGADVVCRVVPDSNVRFLLPPDSTVNIKTKDAELTRDEAHKVVTFGAGTATVTIEAGGEIRFAHGAEEDEGEGLQFKFDFDFDFDFDERLAESLSSIETRLGQQLSNLDEQLSRTIARQTEKMQERAERLRQQAEKRAERLRKATERRDQKDRTRTWSASWSEPPTPPPPPSPPPPPPVSDEERMTVLRMLENGQINVDEAERLLAALEGRSK